LTLLASFSGLVPQTVTQQVSVDFKTRVKLIAHYHSVQNIYGIKNHTLQIIQKYLKS